MAKFWMRAAMGLLGVMLIVSGAMVAFGRMLPRGDELAYAAQGFSFDNDLYLLDVEHRLSVPLTFRQGYNTAASWSPDGTRLVYSSNRTGQAALYIMNADGSDDKIYASDYPLAFAPAWSPDGTQIAFGTTVQGSPKIGLLDLTTETTYVVNLSGATDSPPVWSPDGKWILFDSYRDGNPRLFGVQPGCANAEHGCRYNEKPLLDKVGVLWPISWSPEGDSLVFAGLGFRGKHIYRVAILCDELDSACWGQPEPITDAPSDYYYNPVWSPDGTQIAYNLDEMGSRIYVTSIDGSTRQLLANDVYLAPVSWSWDSRTIAFTQANNSQLQIKLIDVATGVIRLSVDNSSSTFAPLWRPR